MAGLGRAASVPEGENFPAAREAGDDGLGGRVRRWLERSDTSIDDFLMLGEMLGEVLCWHARIIQVRAGGASARRGYRPRRRRRGPELRPGPRAGPPWFEPPRPLSRVRGPPRDPRRAPC